LARKCSANFYALPQAWIITTIFGGYFYERTHVRVIRMNSLFSSIDDFYTSGLMYINITTIECFGRLLGNRVVKKLFYLKKIIPD
jgi:hypothetical protein